MRSRLLFFGLALVLSIPTVARAADSEVRVSSIGYPADRAKRASVTASGTEWKLVRESDGQVVASGTLGSAKADPDTGQNVAIADFTSVTENGSFHLEVPGVGRSVTFPIAADVYREAFTATMLGFYGWRCNTAVSLTWKAKTYAHEACHMDDGHTDYIGSTGKRDGTKGWHDAGDYGKYTVNAGVTVGSLLAAWEEYQPVLETYHWAIPESGGPLPDFLAEVRWELEWLLKMQYSESDGRVSHKLTSLTFDKPSDASAGGTSSWVMPEEDDMPRYFVPLSSAATADFVAMLAKAARIYKPYDPAFAEQCMKAAQVSYAYLQANTANVSVTDPTSTGGYGTSDADDRLWAAAEMWETTGDAAALTDFETRAARFSSGTATYVDSDFDWGNVKNLGMYVYLLSKRTGKSGTTESAVEAALLKAADTLVAQHNGSGYGRALSGKTAMYYWGSNGSVARTCMLLQVANRLAPKADYLDTCVDQIGWIFGRNYYNRSLVTGIGVDPPMHPHHRPSVADGIDEPWPGLLVGGGNSTSTQSNGNKNGATNWLDEVDAYELNEVAINWNAPLVYALASFLDTNTEPPANPDAGLPSLDAEASAGDASGGVGGEASGGAGGGSGGQGGGQGEGGTRSSVGGSLGGGSSGNASGGVGGSTPDGSGGGAAGGVSGAGGLRAGGSAGSGGAGGQGSVGSTKQAGSSGACSCELGGVLPVSWIRWFVLVFPLAGLARRRLSVRKPRPRER